MTRVWLNHWFSTAYNIVTLLRDDNSDLFVIGSNRSEHSPIEAACDEWYQEPGLVNAEDYVEYCLSFCSEHAVDVFVPRRFLVPISARKRDFEQNGVKVMLDEHEIVGILNDKLKAYEFLKTLGIGNLPEYRAARSANELRAAFVDLTSRYERVCVKFASDVGGKSYRLIDNSINEYEALFKKSTTRISFDSLLRALGENEPFPPIVMMPYLPGKEASIDCLKTKSGTIAISRIKTSSRVEQVKSEGPLIEECKRILELVPLENPCNIQYKYLEDTPYLLEINTRMSGGIHMTCAASGINIPSIALNKLLGVNAKWELDMRSNLITQVETPVVIDGLNARGVQR